MAVRLGELLLREKRITAAQLQEALGHQRSNGGRLGSSLVKLGFVRDDDISAVLSRQYGVPAITLSQFTLDAAIVRLVPAETANKYHVIPVSRSGTTLTLAMIDPTNVFAMDDIKFMTGLHVEPVVASENAIRDAIDRYYTKTPVMNGTPASDIVSRALEDLGPGADDLEVLAEAQEIDAAALEKQSGEAPIVRLVNALLLSAIQRGASDIHLEPYEKEMRVRFRIDGVLQPVMSPSLKYRDPITSRMKIMARLDIAERRLPQDGRIKLTVRGHEIDFRVSTMPALYGEKVVLRVLDRTAVDFDYEKLGLPADVRAGLERAFDLPNGMVLVTGPTGSGKTTTLYTGLTRLNTTERNVVTVEDPIEYQLTGINQIQVRPQIGLNFATLLRSILRQDPDVIMIGEIRDLETLQIAVQAALTGHLVLSTVHTNSAAATMTRLRDMGLEDYLMTATLKAVLAQRLVRRLCRTCRVAEEAPAALRERFELDRLSGGRPVILYHPRGCADCRGTGFRGRRAIAELLIPDRNTDRLIFDGADDATIERAAIESGMRPIFESGLLAVLEGDTTIEEVVRCIRSEA